MRTIRYCLLLCLMSCRSQHRSDPKDLIHDTGMVYDQPCVGKRPGTQIQASYALDYEYIASEGALVLYFEPRPECPDVEIVSIGFTGIWPQQELDPFHIQVENIGYETRSVWGSDPSRVYVTARILNRQPDSITLFVYPEVVDLQTFDVAWIVVNHHELFGEVYYPMHVEVTGYAQPIHP